MICNQTTFLPHIFIFIFFYPALFICRVCEWLLDDLWTGTLSRMGGASKWLTQKDCGKTKGWRRVFCLGIRWRKPVCRDARSHLYFPRVKSDMQRKTVVTVWPAKCSTLLTKTRERESNICRNISPFQATDLIAGCSVRFTSRCLLRRCLRAVGSVSLWLRTKLLGKCTIRYIFFTLPAYFIFCFIAWRRSSVHVRCTVWKWSLSLGENTPL